jgi:hypothetical protein
VPPEVPVAVDAAVRLIAAAVLLYSAGQKLVAPSAIRQTIRTLRLPVPHVLAAAVAVAELAAAVLLVAAPRLWWTSALIAGLGVSFPCTARKVGLGVDLRFCALPAADREPGCMAWSGRSDT